MTKFGTSVSAYSHHASKVDLLSTFPPASPLGMPQDNLKPPSAVNELSTSSSSRVSGFSRFNRDEYNLRRKQVKINSILKMTGSHLEEIENVTEDDVQQDKKLKEDLILKEDEEKREKRSYAPIEATRLRRLSQQYQQRLKMGPPAGPTRDKKVVANLSKSVEKLNCIVEETNRKTSLPANIHFHTVNNNLCKPKNWCKDKSWLQESDVVSNEKRLQLKEWLESCNTSDLMDLQIQLDWENNRPSKTTGINVDPYNPIRGEKYLIKSPDYLKVLQGFSGECALTLINSGDNFRGMFDDGQRDGAGTLTFGMIHQRLLGITKIEGVYEEDMLKGPGTIHYTNGERLSCEFIHGVPNGPGKLFDKENNIKQVGFLSKGFWSGLTWMWKEGGTFLHGNVNYFGQWSGNKIAYIYPDLKHCLMGSFTKGKLEVAQFCYIASIRFIKGYIPNLTYSECQGPLFNYDRGTEILMCKNLMVPDPYELNTVVVKASKMKGGGEGLFAKVDVPAHRIVAFYNGVQEQVDDDDDKDAEDDWEANAYKIMDMLGTDPQTGKCGIIDVPPEYVSTKKYIASMAHKCNHSFDPNAKFVLGFHPRWGQVPSVQTLKAVEANEEITVSYDYSLDKAPPWYQDLYAKRFLDSYMSSKKATNM